MQIQEMYFPMKKWVGKGLQSENLMEVVATGMRRSKSSTTQLSDALVFS